MTRNPRTDPEASLRATTPSPMDDIGRPESETGTPERPAYGEPKGPLPPHFEIMPKDEVERRARSPQRHFDPPTAGEATSAPAEREVGGFISGMVTPETFRTTGDQQPKVVSADRKSPDDADAP
jgi:hypothetical protein